MTMSKSDDLSHDINSDSKSKLSDGILYDRTLQFLTTSI